MRSKAAIPTPSWSKRYHPHSRNVRAIGRWYADAGTGRALDRQRCRASRDRYAGRAGIPILVKELAKLYPDQIVLAVDVWQGQVMTEGWRSQSAFTPEAFIEAFEGTPFAAILVTDIDSDMEDVDAQLGLISGIAEQSRTPVIASGVVRTADDISRLAYVHNISGALVGRALFRKTIDLADALEVAAQAHEPVAEFQ